MYRLLIAFLLLHFCSEAQQYSFVNFSTNSGLPQSQVTAMSQDHENYLWIATLGGAARFNGEEFLSFSTNDGLLNNKVSTIQYLDGKVYLGHEGGLSIIQNNKVIANYQLQSSQQNVSVSSIISFNNTIIVGVNGGGLFELKDKKLQEIKSSENLLRIKEIICIENKYYIATRDGLFTTIDFKSFSEIKDFEETSINSIKLWKDNTLLVCTPTQGLFEYDLVSGKTKKIELPTKNSENQEVYKYLFVDNQSRIWIIGKSGILVRDKSGKTQYLDEKSGLPTVNFRTIYQDIEGNIWLGSDGKGILKYPEDAFTFFDKKDNLASELIMSISQDQNGTFHLGSFDKGLIKMSKDKSENIELDNNLVWCSMLNIENKNWYGTEFGLVSIDKAGNKKYYYEEDGCPGNKITTLYKLSNSSFLIGGINGLSIYENSKIRINSPESNPPGSVRNILVYSKDIYCATDKGLYKISGNKLEDIDDKKSVAYSLAKFENAIYFGTSDGLFKLNPVTQKIEKILLSKNPSSSFINFLNATPSGLFVGTNNGLYLFNEKEILHFGIESGLIDLETNLNSSFYDKNGNLWFGTAEGLVKFNFKKEITKENKSQPNLVLEEILLNYKEFDYSKYAKKFAYSGLPLDLSLPYTMNTLTFEMNGISLSQIKSQKYQYWLEGLEGTWSPPGTNKSITYTSLPAGEYTFHYKAIDQEGHRSQEKKISFIIRAPFYKTWYFYLFIFIIFVAIIIGLFRLRIKRERQKNYQEMLEYKSRMIQLEQQSLNASMNRHFIFNSLNSIQYFINNKDRISANKYLSSFAKLIRKNLDSSAEGGSMVSLEQELERLELYLSLEQMRFQDRFEYTIDSGDMDLDSIMIPSMLLQPFVENSIIHGILPDEDLKGKINIKIRNLEDSVQIEIKDNGMGIDNSMMSKTSMDGDHKSHGMSITSKRMELFSKMKEQNYNLFGPVQINNSEGKSMGTEVIFKIPIE